MSILVVVGCADVGYNIYMATQSILFTVLAVIVTGGVITFIGFQFNEAKITRALGFTSRKERYEFEREILLSNRVVKNEHQHSDQKVK
jgi:xanthine/uracil permease